MKEEEVYLKALDVLNDALDGRTVNPVAVSTANSMFLMLWSSVHQERVKSQQIKDALRDVWDEKIEEEKRKND